MRAPQLGEAAPTADELVWTPRLGAHLEASRQAAGLRRKDLAARLGVTEETIRLWERGRVQPSADRLARLIALLSIEAAEWSPPTDPDLDRPPLARRLRNERVARRRTQVEASLILEVPQATYAAWETGRTTPSPALFPSLASFLGITASDVATLCATPFVVDTTGWPPFGQFVGARRQQLRLSRGDLATTLGVAVGTVVAWEHGHRSPGPKKLPRLAEALGVPVASLVAAMPHPEGATPLGEVVTTRQRELGLPAAEIAHRVGTTEATVSRWVHGHSRPAPANLERLAEVLDLRTSDLASALEESS
ncbi:MAG: helix-turn-helix domain-containing protein [Acidimicrobiales bacterium]